MRILIVVFLIIGNSFAATIFVPQNYPSIQMALYYVATGDSVIVAPGTFNGGFIWSGNNVQNLTILGAGAFGTSVTLLDGGAGTTDGIYLDEAVGWEIAGLQLAHFYSGIYIEYCHDLNIHHNYMRDCFQSHSYGLIAEFNQNIYYHNNVIDNMSYVGVRLQGNTGMHIYNNTVVNTAQYHGFLISGDNTGIELINNIIAFNSNDGVQFYDGSQGDAVLTYNDNCENGTNWANCTPGIGNISQNPLFVTVQGNEFTIAQNSPCIDTGDPAFPLDPDNTRIDIGAYFYDQSWTQLVTISLTPYNPPIQIPANGGTFEFNISIANSGSTAQIADSWTNVTLPNSTTFGPILNFQNLTLSPGASLNRDRIQAVPANAPAGNYTYNAYIGNYPNNVWNEDHFDFEKLLINNGSSCNYNWSCWGENFGDEEIKSYLPSENTLYSPYPNPFNPSTNISFKLSNASFVKLVIYDVTGREVECLINGWLSSGFFKTTFDGSRLASGVYFVDLQAGDFHQTRKLLLTK